MPQRNRKSEQIRRANRVIQSRSFILMLVMGVLLFVVLFFKLYQLQIGRHDELQKKAINQQVRSTCLLYTSPRRRAGRGGGTFVRV